MKPCLIATCVFLVCICGASALPSGRRGIRAASKIDADNARNVLSKLGGYAKRTGLLKHVNKEDQKMMGSVLKSNDLDEARSSLMEFFLEGRFDKYVDKIANPGSRRAGRPVVTKDD